MNMSFTNLAGRISVKLKNTKCCNHFQRCRVLYTSSLSSRKIHLSTHSRSPAGIGAAPSNPEDSSSICIPNRIHREPTSILEAIARTVQKDHKNPPYKYIDDPEAIPTSSIDKKAYSIAKASGQRAARYVISQYPRYFDDNPSEPSIEAFLPPFGPQLPENTEDGLRERLTLCRVQDACKSYKSNVEAGTELPPDLVCDLLELLCVYNSDDPTDTLLPDEQLFSRILTPDSSRQRVRNQWKDEGPAEEVFRSMKEPSERAYCSLIRGRAKYFQVDAAYQLFTEMSGKGMRGNVETYNAIIGLAGYLKNHLEEKINFIKELFASMQNAGVRPTLDTFNSALAVFPRSTRFNPPLVAKFVSAVLNEMSANSIEPSLASWYHVIRVFYYDDESQSGVLHEIVDRLEGKELEATHPDDLEFFAMAMIKCAVNLKDLELAYRINDLLETGQNCRLIGDNFREGSYYYFFMKVLCMFEQIDTIMEHYEKYVPHSFSPTFNSLDDLFEALDLNEGYEYLPKVWSDIFSLGYSKSAPLLEKITGLMAKKKHSGNLQETFYQLVCDRFETHTIDVDILEEKDELGRTELLPGISAPIMANMCQICMDYGDANRAEEIFSFYVDYKNKIRDKFGERALVGLADHFITTGDFKNALEVVRVMSSFAHSAIDATADKIKTKMTLTDQQKSLVADLL